MAVVRILGVDVATRLGRVGLAAGRWEPDSGAVVVDEVVAGGREGLAGPRTGPTVDMVRRVSAWLADRIPADGRVLIGLDAPLGWPAPLADGLHGHRAGDRLPAPEAADRLWRRATDVHLHQRLGKLPLEVGADRIARAAWAGLEILHAVRRATGRALPTVLDVADAETAAVEVYPAGTLTAVLGRTPPSYKGRDPAPRATLLDALRADGLHVGPADAGAALQVDHAFDALVCLVACGDALAGRTEPVPDDLREVAAREGWIHVRA